MSGVLTNEDDPRVQQLRERLDRFYAETVDYTDFESVNAKPEYWAHVTERVRQVLKHKDSCRVLEFGSGMSGYPESLGDLRSSTHFCAQDVTDRNRSHLEAVSDDVYIGDVLAMSGQFDVIFSTFAFEHVSNPRAVFRHLLNLLSPGGSIFIACPSYGFPLYVPPSARHYGFLRRMGVMWSLACRRLYSMIARRPAYVIHVDPAVLHVGWFRDADAIHWPSIGDLKRTIPANCSIRRVPIQGHRGLKGLFYRTFLLLFVEIRSGT